MAVLKLTINDKLLDKLLGLLDEFKGKGLEIERLDSDHEAHKKYVQEQLERLDAGEGDTMSVDELNRKLEDVIRKYEGKNP